jgi:cell division protein FtsB
VKKFNSDWVERNVYYREMPGSDPKCPQFEPYTRPVIVCLCGSTRFMEAWQAANLSETLAGKIVLSIGCNTKSDADLQRMGELTDEKKAELDELHKRKIDLADEILVLNVGGYVGESTRSEVLHAQRGGKPIRWLEPDKIPELNEPQSAS